jgi:hypothetical protein
MTAEATASAQSSEEWTYYDAFDGPGLDDDRWASSGPPLPEGGNLQPDPNAVVEVANGEVHVSIPEFSLSHDTFQPADNVKFLMFGWEHLLPEDGLATFGVDMAVKNFAGSPDDVRLAMAAFNVVDQQTGLIFDVGGTQTRVYAVHERLAFVPGEYGFGYAIESPFLDFDDDFGDFRACEVTLDRTAGSARWVVDGETVYEVESTEIPEQVRFGFGMFTMVPQRDGASRCLQGQGLDGRWRRFRFKGAVPKEG